MTLKDNILKEIKSNYQLRRALMDFHNISEYTLLKWLRENNTDLLRLDSLMVVAAYVKKEVDDLYIKEECDFKPVI